MQSEQKAPDVDNGAEVVASSTVDLLSLVQPAAEKIKPFAELLKLCPDVLELESRLVLRTAAGVSGHIPQPYFKQILSFLKRNSSHPELAFEVIPWYESVDFFFANDVRLTKEGNNFTWMRKQKLLNADFVVPERPLSVRVSLKRESKCEPVTDKPVFVRSKKRCSFIDRHLRMDFTMVWQGKDEQEISKTSGSPDFEIEVEVVNKHQLVACNVNSLDIVSDLLMRSLELLGSETPVSLCELASPVVNM